RIARHDPRAARRRLRVEAGRSVRTPDDASVEVRGAQREHPAVFVERSAPGNDPVEREHEKKRAATRSVAALEPAEPASEPCEPASDPCEPANLVNPLNPVNLLNPRFPPRSAASSPGRSP